jgi:hypothetical protein
LRLGRFHVLRGPGLFFIVPIIDTIPYWIDTRVIASSFTAERTLTKDTVPVNVDAVLFWKVVDPMKAALDVADYRGAINWAAQTALRDVIGKTVLSDMLEGREKISSAAVFYQVVADRLIALAARHRIPALYEWREFVVAGGLMSYNANRAESGRQVGVYAAQILKGAKPSDLPVVQSSSFEFVLNLRTARALDLAVPPMLLARADEVIE